MATDKQFEANRRNTKRSTGPVSETGKLTSSTNATIHGAYARRARAITCGELIEDQDTIDSFIDALVTDLRPRGAVEREQAFLVAMAYVQARRVMSLEALGHTHVTTLDELIELTTTITAINARVGAGLSRALREYRALLEQRPPKGSLSAAMAEMVEELDRNWPQSPQVELATPGEPLELEAPVAEETDPRNEPNSRPSVAEEDVLDHTRREEKDP